MVVCMVHVKITSIFLVLYYHVTDNFNPYEARALSDFIFPIREGLLLNLGFKLKIVVIHLLLEEGKSFIELNRL